MRALVLAMISLVGCAGVGPTKVDIEILNNTSQPVQAALEAGLLSKSIAISPHQKVSYWIYREFLPGKVRLVIIEMPPENK